MRHHPKAWNIFVYTARRSILVLCVSLMQIFAAAPLRAATPSASQTYFFLVFNAPVAGKEAEYNKWYSEQHEPDVVSIPGFVSAQRFVYNDVQLRAVALKKPKYLVIYKIVTPNLPSVIAEVKRRLKNGQTRVSNSLDPNSGQMYIYRAFRPEVQGAGGEPADAKPGPVQTYYQVVFGDATAGQDSQFNDWYDHDHAPNMVAAPGFVFAQRAIVNDVQMLPLNNPSRYLALFRIDTSDLPAVLRYKSRGSAPPASFDRTRTFGYTYKAIGPLLSGDQIRAERAAEK